MEDYMQEKNINLEIDFKRICDVLLKKCWIIILAAVFCASAAFAYTHFCITPLYQSSVMFYVNNSTSSNSSSGISNSDVLASKSLAETYIVIVTSHSTMDAVIDYAGLDKTSSALKGMISAAAVRDTEILRVVVQSPDPYEAKLIANAIAHVFPLQVEEIVKGSSAEVVEFPLLASRPSSPNVTRNCAVGFGVGLLAAIVVILLLELFNVYIRSEEDIVRSGSYPVLTSVPDMAAIDKSGSYYTYGGKKKTTVTNGKTALIGKEINFTASESYKLLRTKLQYSFADGSHSRVIGISSALVAEGKSVTATNLAYTLSQLDKRVLLIDCDMRRPSLSIKLPIQKKPGLSGYLSGQHKLEAVIQKCGLPDDETAFDVIASGHTPPNPVELLSSPNMADLLAQMREKYDYIIMDLPPIGEVSDALAVSKELDGVLLVVRQHYCNRYVLRDTIRQFEFVNCKILGMVYNFIQETGSGYGKHYYRRYYKRYGYKYAGSYLRTAKDTKDAKDAKETAGQVK